MNEHIGDVAELYALGVSTQKNATRSTRTSPRAARARVGSRKPNA